MFDVDSLLRWGKVLLANSSCHTQRERLMTTWESLSHTSQQSHVRTQNFVTRDGSRDTCDAVMHRALRADTDWVSPGSDSCLLLHSAAWCQLTLSLCLSLKLATVNIDTGDTWASDCQKWVTGEYLAFLWVHQINCHWDLDWNINRPASHIRLTSEAKNQSPQKIDWIWIYLESYNMSWACMPRRPSDIILRDTIKCKCNMHVVILPFLKIHKQQREEDWKCVELFWMILC